MKKTTLQLTTITCPSCVRRIENAVSKQTGVTNVEVKFNASKVEVEHDELVISSEALATLIQKIGYRVLSVK